MTPARLLLAAAAVLPLLLPPTAAAAPGEATASVPGASASRPDASASRPDATASRPDAAASRPDAAQTEAPAVPPDDLPVLCPAPAPVAAKPAAPETAAPKVASREPAATTGAQVPSAAQPAARTSKLAPAAPIDGAGGAPPSPPPSRAPTPQAQATPALATPPVSAADAESLARAYRRTGVAPSVERATEALVPFGHVRPILRCAPLRACVVVLEAGELVLSTSLGDGERWLVQAAASGAGGTTPILVVKPVACDLSTNLVIATDRRIYELALDSPPCRNADSGDSTYNPHLQYTGVTRFYYPDELVRRWAGEEELARSEAERASQGRTPLAPTARLAHLNFDYSWDRGRRWPWVPAQVFDDGEHTYLALSAGARLADMPLLFALGPRGELTLINHHLEGQTLIADRVLDRAVLVVGAASKRDEKRLEIVNRAYPASAAIGGRH
jgi:P-type conjugative transfer protein TrbG